MAILEREYEAVEKTKAEVSKLQDGKLSEKEEKEFFSQSSRRLRIAAACEAALVKMRVF